MSKDTEVDMKEVELTEIDPEKQPMTGDGPAAGEKNGSVKLKLPEDEVKFTGLSKEELMKVAGTPGWVRTRWVLLVLFWLGWLGMLAGAIAIIIQAPRCKPLPEMNWWNEGPLYQIADLKAFTDDGIKGVENKLDSVNQLKVKGLVLGPIHTVQADMLETLNLKAIDPTQGGEEHLAALLEKAHKKGIQVVLDLTPNYLGSNPWFGDVALDGVLDDVTAASEYWLAKGVDGVKVSGFSAAAPSPAWPKLLAAVQSNRTEDVKSRALIGVVEGATAVEVSLLLNTSGVDLISSDLLSTKPGGIERAQAIDTLLADNKQTSLAWGLGASMNKHLAKEVGPALVRLYQLLLFTLPGTPVFTYGDEIGLMSEGAEAPMMLWDIEKEPAEGAVVNETAEVARKEHVAIRKWFRSLSDIRVKERSLQHGHYQALHSSPSALAFLRLWDQSDRFVAAFNWGDTPAVLTLKATEGEMALPAEGKVRISTDAELAEGTMMPLDKIPLGPKQAVLLQFPYLG